jgi:hypothetical protein
MTTYDTHKRHSYEYKIDSWWNSEDAYCSVKNVNHISIVQKKIAQDTLTAVTTVTLKVLCTSVKREETSKVLEERVLTKTRVLKQNKISEHLGILREMEHCELLSSPKCCQDGKIWATKRYGRASGARVSI